ncbi:MAG TPA: (Fe-S)-binding protein [Candidatus Binataceae bacterium]|nr:(Fe-S)-binding protein [Candidatus Binataceae bacterium]
MTEVKLFATCLAEEFFPSAIAATKKVLEELKLRVTPLRTAFCCGQAPFNEGLRDEAIVLARSFLKASEPGIPIVIPSGSCASMIKIFYPELLAAEPASMAKATALRPWIFELSQFLVNVLKVKFVGAHYPHKVAYHPACHLTRELRVVDEPRVLLSAVRELKLVEFRNPEECCGFGGMFSVKYPHISLAMAQDKIERLKESGADTLVANDAGCLMQLGGVMHRQRVPIQTRHIAEVLAAR